MLDASKYMNVREWDIAKTDVMDAASLRLKGLSRLTDLKDSSPAPFNRDSMYAGCAAQVKACQQCTAVAGTALQPLRFARTLRGQQ